MIHFAVDIASHNVVETMKGSFGSSG
jgi:hypothetical protein